MTEMKIKKLLPFVFMTAVIFTTSVFTACSAKTDITGTWSNDSLLKTKLFAEEGKTDEDQADAEVYTRMKTVYTFSDNGEFTRHTKQTFDHAETYTDRASKEDFEAASQSMEYTAKGSYRVSGSKLHMTINSIIIDGQEYLFEDVFLEGEPQNLTADISKDESNIMISGLKFSPAE